MNRYILSPNLRIVSGQGSREAMVYHTLYGNPRFVNSEGLRFLDLFRQPKSLEEIAVLCDDDPQETIKDFTNIFFLVIPGLDEKKILREKRIHQLAQVCKKATIDRIGLSVSEACNLACKHCIHFQRKIGQEKPALLNMNWQTAKHCLDRYIQLMKEQG